MDTNLSLDGSMIPRRSGRAIDERSEPRYEPQSRSAELDFRGRRHVVRLINLSPSGAMVYLGLIPHIGETIRLRLIGRASIAGRVTWVRDGKVGVTFDAPLE